LSNISERVLVRSMLCGTCGTHTGSFVGVFALELCTSFVNICSEVSSCDRGAHRARDWSIMGGFALDVEPATLLNPRSLSVDMNGLHNTVGCLGLDLEVGRSSVVEILIKELFMLSDCCSVGVGERDFHTSFAGFAMSPKGTGTAMLIRRGWRCKVRVEEWSEDDAQ
jgi:hypothetical protein